MIVIIFLTNIYQAATSINSSYYIRSDIKENIPGSYYKTLGSALSDAAFFGGTIYIETGIAHYLEEQFIVYNSLNIVADNNDPNAAIYYAEITIIKNGTLEFLSGDFNFSFSNLRIVQNDHRMSLESSIFIFGRDNYVIFKNIKIIHIDALTITVFLIGRCINSLLIENLFIEELTNTYMQLMFFINGSSGYIRVYNLQVNSLKTVYCTLFLLNNTNQINFSAVTITNSLIKGYLDIRNSSNNISFNKLESLNNILLGTLIIINGSITFKQQIFLSHLLLINNQRKLEIDEAPLLLYINGSRNFVNLNWIVMKNNEGFKKTVFFSFENCFEIISLIDIELSENIYFQEAVSFKNAFLLSIKNFNCFGNNEESNSGHSCLKFSNAYNVLVENSKFVSNFAYSATCGLIFTEDKVTGNPVNKTNAMAELRNCSFILNEVKSTQDNETYFGTSIYCSQSSQLTLSSCIFIENYHYYGKGKSRIKGSPCLDSSKELKTLNILSCRFSGNQATASSNCLSFVGGLLYINQSVFEGNENCIKCGVTNGYQPFTFGGAIQCGPDFLIIENVQFVKNIASKAGSLGFFVKLDFYLQKIQVSNSRFGNNRADGKGGAFYLENYNRLSYIKIKFENSTFFENTAEQEGGVAYNNGILEINSEILFMSCFFLRNRGTRGAVFFNAVLNFMSIFEYCVFSYNSATSTIDGGSVFYNDDNHDIILRNCLISHNIALMRGGFAQLMKGKFYDFGSFYNNNSAGHVGGVFILHRVSEVNLLNSVLKDSKNKIVRGNYFIKRIQILGYSADSGGACFIMQSSIFTMANVTIENGSSIRGGGMSIMQEGSISIKKSSFIRCQSRLGSVLYSTNTLSIIIFESVSVFGCQAIEIGLFYLEFSTINFLDIVLELNRGSLLAFKDVVANINNFTLNNHECQKINIDGCILNGETSTLNFSSLTIQKVIMYDRSIGMSVTLSRIAIIGSSIKNLSCERSPCLLKAFRATNIFINRTIFADFLRLAIYIENSFISFSDNQVSMNQMNGKMEEGFLHCKDPELVFIERSNFTRVIGENGGVLNIEKIKKSTAETKIFLLFNIFVNNIARKKGGAIYIGNENIELRGNVFTYNTAIIGGAIYLNCSRELICLWTIMDSFFENNVAEQSGGAIYWLNRLPLEENNTFRSNKAKHGSEIASNPIKIIAANDTFEEFVSGQVLVKNLDFFIVDTYNQVCSTLSSKQVLLSFSSNVEHLPYFQGILGNKLFAIVNGKIIVEKATFISFPGLNTKLKLWTDAIAFYSVYMNKFPNQIEFHKNNSDSYIFEFEVAFRKCVRGEIFKYKENVCLKCSNGTYSFTPEIEMCFDCPPNSVCVGDSILAVENYWAESENSTILYECTILKDACPGGYFKNRCNPGYWGILCSNCEYSKNKKYFRNTFSYCIDCQDKNIILTICLLIFFSSCILLQLLLTLRECGQVKVKKMDITASMLMNILINYFVLVGAGNKLTKGINSFLQDIFALINVIFELDNTSDISTCFLDGIMPIEETGLFEAKQILNSIVWVFLLTLPIFFILVTKLIKKYKSSEQSNSNILILYISLYKLIMQPMIKFYFKNFQCITIENKTYLKLNTSMRCFEKDHKIFILKIILPGMMLLFVAPLSLMFIYILRKRKEIDNPNVGAKIWLLTLGYKKKYFYWEYVLLVKKIIIISMPIILGHSPKTCLLAMILVAQLSLFVQNLFKPYQSDSLNSLAWLQNFSLFVTYGSNLLQTTMDDYFYRMIFYLASVSINFVFLVYWAHFFFIFFKAKIKPSGILGRGFNIISHILIKVSHQIIPNETLRKKKKINFVRK